jgi:hypothetical protein
MDGTADSEVFGLLPTLRALQREEKLFIIQFLVSELSQQEGMGLLSNVPYPVWSPMHAYDAANTLLQLLNEPEPKK